MVALLNISLSSYRLVVTAYINPFFMLAWSHFVTRELMLSLNVEIVMVDLVMSRHYTHIMASMMSFMSRSQVQVCLCINKFIAIRLFLVLVLVIV